MSEGNKEPEWSASMGHESRFGRIERNLNELYRGLSSIDSLKSSVDSIQNKLDQLFIAMNDVIRIEQLVRDLSRRQDQQDKQHKDLWNKLAETRELAEKIRQDLAPSVKNSDDFRSKLATIAVGVITGLTSSLIAFVLFNKTGG